MNDEQFNEIVDHRLNTCIAILCRKNEEYASTTDRLHNFKVAAAIDNELPVQASWGMFKKHLVSIIDLKNDPAKATPDIIEEKFTDAINYLLLMEALLLDGVEK